MQECMYLLISSIIKIIPGMREKESIIRSNAQSMNNSINLRIGRYSKSELANSIQIFKSKPRDGNQQQLVQQKSFQYRSLQANQIRKGRSSSEYKTLLQSKQLSSSNQLRFIKRKFSTKNEHLSAFKPMKSEQSSQKIQSRSRLNSSQKLLKISQHNKVRKDSSILNSFPFSIEQMLPSQNSFDCQMKQLSSFYDEDSLFIRLASFSKEKVTKISLRLYREQLQNLITYRYGKDRVSAFLQFQYIEDYFSIQRTISSELLKFTNKEVLLFCFIIMDHNKDGLITADDLSSFVGEKNENMVINPLIMEDLSEIIRYIQKRQQNGEKVEQKVSSEHPFFLEQGLTLASYRKFLYQNEKMAKNEQKRRRLSKLISSNPHQALFTLQESMNKIMVQKRKRKQSFRDLTFSLLKFANKPKKREGENSYFNSFSLNFQSFSEIFRQKIPKTFADFLYFMGGVECPKLSYSKVQTQFKQNNQLGGQFDLYTERQKKVFQFIAIKLKEDIKYNSLAYNVLKIKNLPKGDAQEKDQN